MHRRDRDGDYDALLVLSFGGPEGPDEVEPFLRHVTAGRGVPAQRLADVAEHYHHFGGFSPINACNRELVRLLRWELHRQQIPLPVYFGNRNWHPFVEHTVAGMADHGVRRALVLATSPFGGHSACRQYHEDLARARAAVGAGAPELVKLRHFFDHPRFVDAWADSVLDACRRATTAPQRLVFTAHSIPQAADRTAGAPREGGRRYSHQVAAAARLVADQAGVANHDLVWQSRSGSANVPWLGPDILHHLDALAAAGCQSAVVAPIGFVSEHMEVLWDINHEARRRAQQLGICLTRAQTPGTDPRFADMVAELVAEHVAHQPARKLTDLPRGQATGNGQPCSLGCCASTTATGANSPTKSQHAR